MSEEQRRKKLGEEEEGGSGGCWRRRGDLAPIHPSPHASSGFTLKFVLWLRAGAVLTPTPNPGVLWGRVSDKRRPAAKTLLSFPVRHQKHSFQSKHVRRFASIP